MYRLEYGIQWIDVNFAYLPFQYENNIFYKSECIFEIENKFQK